MFVESARPFVPPSTIDILANFLNHVAFMMEAVKAAGIVKILEEKAET